MSIMSDMRLPVWREVDVLVVGASAGAVSAALEIRRQVLDLETLAKPKIGDVTGPVAPDKKYRIGEFFPSAAPLMHEPGAFSVPVQARDFRAVLFVNLPTVQGTGF